MSETQAVIEFHGDQILTVRTEDGIYIPMKPIVKNMGLDWATQSNKIQSNQGCRHKPIPIETASGTHEMICIPLKKFNGWLFSVNSNKVREDLREKIEQYQEECFHVLHGYWFGQKQEQKQTTLPDFTNPAEAAEAWAKQFREKESAKKELAEAQPQIEFAKAIEKSEDSISVREFAKILYKDGLKIGQNRLFIKLRDLKLIFRNSQGKNEPYQSTIKAGWMGYKEFYKEVTRKSDGKKITKLCHKIKITGKGQIYISKKLMETK